MRHKKFKENSEHPVFYRGDDRKMDNSRDGRIREETSNKYFPAIRDEFSARSSEQIRSLA